MSALSHVMGSDFGLDADGLALVDGSEETRQSLLRRLLTVSGAYIWQLGYGAGLSAKIGDTVNQAALRDLIRAQVEQDAGVDRSQPVNVTITTGASGECFCTVSYVDAGTGQASLLNYSS